MPRNLLIGGAAGQGIDTTAAVFEKLLKQSGYFVFTVRDFMSRVRGGHNFILIRFANEKIMSHSDQLDGIVALNEETVELHRDKLSEQGFILCDEAVKVSDKRMIKIDMQALAKELGNPRVAGSIATGALLKLFGLELEHEQASAVMKEFVKDQYVDINIKAIEAGYGEVSPHYDGDPGDFQDWMLISGNKAVGLGALAAGLRFYSAYPMSPSTGVMEFIASHAEACGVVVEQAEDEIAGMNMAIGASYAGVRAMTGTSGGGFCLKVEALGLAGIAEIPVVVIDVQRPGPATGLPTRTEQSDLKFVINAAQGEFPRIVIALRNHKDAFYQTIRAFKMAEQFQTPVILLSDQYLADSSSTVRPYQLDPFDPFVGHQTLAEMLDNSYFEEAGPEPSHPYKRYRVTDEGISARLYPASQHGLVAADSDEHDEEGRITESAEVRNQQMDKRMRKFELIRQLMLEPEWQGSDRPQVGLIGWGSLYGPLREAVNILNDQGDKRFATIIFGDVWPLPVEVLHKLADRAEILINVEQNATGQLASLIREQTGITCQHHILKYDGRQLSGEEIVARVREVLK